MHASSSLAPGPRPSTSPRARAVPLGPISGTCSVGLCPRVGMNLFRVSDSRGRPVLRTSVALEPDRVPDRARPIPWRAGVLAPASAWTAEDRRPATTDRSGGTGHHCVSPGGTGPRPRDDLESEVRFRSRRRRPRRRRRYRRADARRPAGRRIGPADEPERVAHRTLVGRAFRPVAASEETPANARV